ncbi:MAG: hypothetical protein ACYTFM_12980, partial [Planctomycetota bacterium]|jgi:hypothetical protein
VGENSNIDFDTGRLFARPENWRQFSDDDWQRWIEKTGIDASGATRATVKGLMCEGMIISPANNSWWDKTPAHALATMDLWEKGEPGRPAYMTAQGQLPATYIFKTHEGGIGVLQILEHIEEPPALKIRYKMVEPLQSAVQVEGDKETGETALIVQAADLGASAARRVELSYDDGRSDGQKSIARSGHGVIFDAPGDGYVLKTVRIFGSRYGQDLQPVYKSRPQMGNFKS